MVALSLMGNCSLRDLLLDLLIGVLLKKVINSKSAEGKARKPTNTLLKNDCFPEFYSRKSEIKLTNSAHFYSSML